MKKLFLTIIKDIVLPLFIISLVSSSIIFFSSYVHAQSASDILQNIGEGTKLPSYQDNTHAQASYEPGASNITSAIYYFLDFVQYILGSIAVITIVIAGIRLVTGGRQIEEVANKQKEHLKYAVIGLVIVIIAPAIIKQVFFGEQGEVYSSQATLIEAAKRGSEQLKGIYSAIMYFMGAVAVLMIVISGFRLVTAAGNEDAETKSKNTIIYAVIGLMVLGLAEFVVKEIVFPRQGEVLPDIEKAKHLIVNLTNFVSGFISTIAVVIIIYGGYLYVVSFGNEDGTGKAKKAILGAVIGLLLAMAAFAIVNTVVRFEPRETTEMSGSSAPPGLPTNSQ